MRRNLDAEIAEHYPDLPQYKRDQLKRFLQTGELAGIEPKWSLSPAEYQKRQLKNLWVGVNERDAAEQAAQWEAEQKAAIAREAKTAADSAKRQAWLLKRAEEYRQDDERKKRREQETIVSRKEAVQKRLANEGY